MTGSFHSPSSQSLNLNLINQSSVAITKKIEHSNNVNNSGSGTLGQMIFNSNNPFLNDDFDAIVSDGGNCGAENFFNVDNKSDLFFLPSTSSVDTNNGMSRNESEEQDEQLLKNKREKFSNASPTMKICLVVSPPTNKLFQVSQFLKTGSTILHDVHLKDCFQFPFKKINFVYITFAYYFHFDII
jgi:hypothetical protein